MLKRRSTDLKGKKTQRNTHPRKKKPPPKKKTIVEEINTSASAKKIASNPDDIAYDPTFSYCILHFTEVFSGISEFVVCHICHNKVEFLQNSIRGLGFRLDIYCKKCDKILKSIFSSPLIDSAYEVNRRLSLVMRLLGKGLSGMQLFCGMMDLAKPVAQKSFDIILNKIERETSTIAIASMKRAVQEELTEMAEFSGKLNYIQCLYTAKF